MPLEPDRFYAFDPRFMRRAMWACAAACAVLAAWALAEAMRNAGGVLAYARLAVLVVLTAAFATLSVKLRARSGWGVSLDATTLRLSQVLGAARHEIPLLHLRSARRAGTRPDRLLIFLRDASRLSLSQLLFRDARTFAEVAAALADRVSAPDLDA